MGKPHKNFNNPEIPILYQDDLKFSWRKKEIERITKLYNSGMPVQRIAYLTNEHEKNIALLIFHLDIENKLKFDEEN